MSGMFFILFVTVCNLLQCLGKAPHIVFIVADDLGWNDVGWHNPDMITPNLDKFAKAGVILNSSYVQPLCTPSRNCFMSGYYPYHTGLQNGVIIGTTAKALPANITTLPEKLKELGYTTHMVGKWHLGSCNWKYTPTYRGFDSFMGYYNGMEDYYTHMFGGVFGLQEIGYDFRFNESVYHPENGTYSTHTFTDRAIDIISTTDPENDKLFLYLPFQSVHSPLQVPKVYEDMYPDIQSNDRRSYCGMVSALDEAVGKIAEALDSHGFMDNLLMIFTSDNGGAPNQGGNNLPLRGSKGSLWEGGTKGAAFVYSSTLLDITEYTNTEMIHAVDWFPTILTVAGGSPDSSLDGVNQWDTIKSNKSSNRNEFIYNIDEIQNNAAIRVGDYKLLVGDVGQGEWFPLPKLNSPNYPEYAWKNATTVKLFNIKDDPTEHFDISEQNPDIVQKLKDRLEEYRKTLVPAQNPPVNPESDPKNYDGNWSPGWC